MISVDWLQQHFDAANLIVLDATLPKVAAQKNGESIKEQQICGARFFDIKKVFSDPEGQFPNTMMSPENFQKEAQNLGISKDSCIVVYDQYGIYSSPRVWWSFKAMGFKNIAVLDGGLPAWIAAGGITEAPHMRAFEKGNFEAHNQKNMYVDTKDVLKAIQNYDAYVLDARSSARFYGKVPEPREGVRSGHIPTATSFPYANVLSNHFLKSKLELQTMFNSINHDKKAMIFSCGTGITACVLALGAEIAECTNMSVYDGSWTEWGSISDLPIEV